MIYSFSSFGYEGALVSVEVDLRSGIPAVDIIGLSDSSVAVVRDRVRSAFSNSGFAFPSKRVLISLSPADLKKEGAAFDLSIALAVLAKSEVYCVDNVLVMGELELSGMVRGCSGVYAALTTAVGAGIKYAIIPKDSENTIPPGIKVARVKSLAEAKAALRLIGNDEIFSESSVKVNLEKQIEFVSVSEDESIDDIRGLDGLKYAATVAIAGRHNIMVWGSPGCGKTLILSKLPQLMPNLTPDEAQSVTRIHSLAGLMRADESFKNIRPFRMPHQTASIEGICGGGSNCRPGEISLAHNGVLFLDEAAEFRSSVLQMLRVPLESNAITLSRAGRSTVYPAKFQLAMASNPCPCGNYGVPDRVCLCSATAIEQYWRKFSGPLLDRVAIRYNCSNPITHCPTMTLQYCRELIERAWLRQLDRQGKLNQDLDPSEVNNFITLTDNAKDYLDGETVRNSYSPRTVSNILKVARTIADMETDSIAELSVIYIKTAIELHPATAISSENMW